MSTPVSEACAVTPVAVLPASIDLQFVENLLHVLETTARDGRGRELKDALAEGAAAELIERVTSVVASEGIIHQVQPPDAMRVNVHGDLHGHFFDLRQCILSEGVLEGGKCCVFNGDFVDRGAWGVEVVLTLAALKLALPSQVCLLRGNHECEALASVYGFQKELEYKYPGPSRKKTSPLMKKFTTFFSSLPIAALIGNHTLVVHGGLWRRPSVKRKAASGRKKLNSRLKSSSDIPTRENSVLERKPIRVYKSAGLQLGTLEDLRKATKGGLNPGYNQKKHAVASDLLWSDPQIQRGLALNPRGSGLLFGPDASEWFLRQNGLKLLIRSHEGPEARFGRDEMAGMHNGYSLDHDTAEGAVITVFSAADYPQFQYEDGDAERFNNKGAIVVLHPPAYCKFTTKSYAAAPRPVGKCFCDPDAPESADEMPECGGPVSDCEDVSGASDNDCQVPGTSPYVIGAPPLLTPVPDDTKAEVKHVIVSTAAGAMQCNPGHVQALGRGHRSRVPKRSMPG